MMLTMSLISIIREMLILVILAVGLGLAHLALRPDFPWIAEPPEPMPATCELPSDGEDRVFAAVRSISPAKAQALVGKKHVTFIDARAPHLYAMSHIPGALNIPAEEAASLLTTQSLPLPVDNKIIVYCEGGSCERSEYLGKLLHEEAGCLQVHILEGGWTAWREQQGAVEGEGHAPDKL